MLELFTTAIAVDNNKCFTNSTMAATYNAITGCKHRASWRDLPQKKCSSQASTVTTIMNAEKVNGEFHICMAASKMLLFCFHVLGANYNGDDGMYDMATIFVIGICYYISAAILLLECNAELMDLQEEDLDDSGYCMPRVDVTLESFANDNECEARTRFTKRAITTIIGALNQPEIVRIYFHPSKKDDTTNAWLNPLSSTCFERCQQHEHTVT